MLSNENYYPHNFKNSPFGKKKVTDYKKILKYSIVIGIVLIIFYSVKNKNDNISKIQNEIISNKNLIESIKKREQALNQGISICKNELEKLKNEKNNLNEKKTIIKYENEKLEKNKNENSQSEKVKIDENISKKKNELNELTNKYNELEKKFKDLTTEKENSLKEIGKLENDIKDLEIKYKEQQKIKEEKQKEKEKELKYNSKIIENDNEYIIFRNSYSTKPYYIELLYRLSRDGSSISSFHNKIKDTKKTLILLLLKDGNKIGGFTTQSWDINGFQFDYYSYLFSIPLSKKYLIQNPNTAIFSSLNEFICFGNGDLKIYSDKILSNFPSSYSYKSNKLELTNGKSSVELVEMEVYKVID